MRNSIGDYHKILANFLRNTSRNPAKLSMGNFPQVVIRVVDIESIFKGYFSESKTLPLIVALITVETIIS